MFGVCSQILAQQGQLWLRGKSGREGSVLHLRCTFQPPPGICHSNPVWTPLTPASSPSAFPLRCLAVTPAGAALSTSHLLFPFLFIPRSRAACAAGDRKTKSAPVSGDPALGEGEAHGRGRDAGIRSGAGVRHLHGRLVSRGHHGGNKSESKWMHGRRSADPRQLPWALPRVL